MIKVIAESTAYSEHLEEAIALSRKLVEASLKEPGCLEYGLFQNTENPCQLTMVESWEDEAALKRHKETAHVKEIVPKLNAIREVKSVVKVLRQL